MIRKRLQCVLFGRQGCGKGTQGQLLADRFDVPLVGAGDLLRAEIAEETPLGSVIVEYVDRGMLVPDELVEAIISKRLKELDLGHGFILDGHPRNINQAESLERLVKINLAIHIKISEREAVRRLLGRVHCPVCRAIYHTRDAAPAVSGHCAVCGHALRTRADDTEESVKRRLMIYEFMTHPMAAYFRSKGVLLEVQGEQSIPFLFEELTKKMAKLGFVS